MAQGPDLEAEEAWMSEWGKGMLEGYAHDPLTARDAFRAAFKAGRSARPWLGVAVMVTKEINGHECILLGQSKKVPGRAKWVIPGGGMRPGETIAQTGRREILGKAGLSVVIPEVFGFEDKGECEYTPAFPKELVDDTGHRIVIFVSGRVTGGELNAGDDLTDVGFFTREQLFSGSPDLTELTRQVLEETEWL